MNQQASPTLRIVNRVNEVFQDTTTMDVGPIGVYSARSPFKETDNEDAAAVIPIDEQRAILAVADGVGGQPGGAEAAEVALQSLEQTAKKVLTEGVSTRAAIMEGIENANHQILDMGIGAATTLALIEIEGNAVRPYHVGDSMILVVGQRGKLRHQTVPHSPVGYAIEAGLLDESEAIHHEDRHVVSNVLGSPNMHIEVGSVLHLKLRDTVLLASDGIFDNLHVPEVVDLIRKGRLSQVVERLSNAARDRMNMPGSGHPSKPDDATFIVYRTTKSQVVIGRKVNRAEDRVAFSENHTL